MKKRFSNIQSFLKRHYNLWTYEPIDSYPRYLNTLTIEFSDFAQAFSQKTDNFLEETSTSFQELFQIASYQSPTPLLNSFFEELKSLMEIPVETVSPLSLDHSFNSIKEKKRHEIETLLPLIKQKQALYGFDHFVDFGGGMGHLAGLMAQNLNIQGHSLDFDKTIQSKGQNILAQTPYGNAINFVHFTLSAQIEKLLPFIEKNTLLLGLHSCGDLSVFLIQAAAQFNVPYLLNFGCCYCRMNTPSLLNISQQAKDEAAVSFSDHALTLASRSFCEDKVKELKHKLKVRYFRALFQLLQIELTGDASIRTLGQTPKEIFNAGFEDYAIFHLSKQKIEACTDLQIKDFKERKDTQIKVREIIALDALRSLFSRIIELAIIIDRYFYLEESGRETQLFQLFNPKISPRNLGIWSKSKEAK